MAKRITEEMKIKINELYLDLGVQKEVAEVLGISASSVSKYLIPNYKKNDKKNIDFSVSPPRGCRGFIENIRENGFCDACKLTEQELNELVQFQKEYF